MPAGRRGRNLHVHGSESSVVVVRIQRLGQELRERVNAIWR